MPEPIVGHRDLFFVPARDRVDDLLFYDYLSPFCFLLIEFHCTFSISFKIIPYYVYNTEF